MRRLLALGAVFVAAACGETKHEAPAQDQASAPPVVQRQSAPVAPVAVDEPEKKEWPASFVWTGGANGEHAYMHFGPDESDDLPIDFSCKAGSGEVTIYTPYAVGDGRSLTLLSGVVRGVFPAHPVDGGEIFDGVAPEADVATAAPVLAEFRKTGALAFGEPLIVLRQADAPELEAIDAFFVRCGS